MPGKPLPDLTRVNGFSYLPDELILSPNAPGVSARRLLRDHFTIDSGQILYRHQGAFYCWTGTHYTEIETEYLLADIFHFLEYARKQIKSDDGEWKSVPFHPKRAHVGEIENALRSAAYLGNRLHSPMWLDETTDLLPHEIISCDNGLLHLPTRSIIPHTPMFYTHNAIDYSCDFSAPAPAVWFSFLKSLWPNDDTSIATLQEIFGYCLVADTSQQKAFLLVGPKRSGKGTIARILESVIGSANVVAPTLTGLGTNFGMQPLIGKRLAIISDARISGRADAAVIAERILSVTGEDAITLDRKNREAWTGKLDTRFLVISNELPRIADASGALASRFIVLVLANSFFGREDRSLTSRLLAERPGILNWAIEGYERLCARGYFTQPDSARDAIRDLEDLGSPISAFIRDVCVVAPGRMVACAELFDRWKAWCDSQNRGNAGTLQTFGRDIRAAVPGLETSHPRAPGGDRIRYYEGIGLA